MPIDRKSPIVKTGHSPSKSEGLFFWFWYPYIARCPNIKIEIQVWQGARGPPATSPALRCPAPVGRAGRCRRLGLEYPEGLQ
eukprot:5909933-Alexandrium_andersonii.AAC.1